ncbi:MAG: macro domain-containing protein [Betaproteobacteria bacterium]
MIEYKTGNLLTASTDALVNTVNTAGVMGKGIALQFKNAFPQMFKAYENACQSGEVKLGKMNVFDMGGLAGGPRWIINFPTKGHWRSKSRLQDVASGLADLVETIKECQIQSIAIPPLGCGNGGLSWNLVRPLIEQALEQVPNVRVEVYQPGHTPASADMPIRTLRPKMTNGRAVLVLLIDRYIKGLMDPLISLLEVHKLMYFMQLAGEPLRLEYQKGKYGPYAPNLEKALRHVEGHYISGFGDGVSTPEKPLELLPGGVEEAGKFLNSQDLTQLRFERVTRLIDGFEDAYGMELLSSTLWAMVDSPAARQTADAAVSYVHSWNTRKKNSLKPEHIAHAWQRLKNEGWDTLASEVSRPLTH